ncbi:PREDICTED: fatty acyl-CoA reductase 1-like [Nicrophorus vespilloides]|uniref:Fatty acyl-CoA reductase n=1 Tax=Nicrophorus vespilloides TaxID=110193 RepID=A0ABM1N1D3_NICVS|nr:PREDICTED: fatty acyl-CoA reductase 1-like [Nicrophorus vespilloides]
MTPKTSLSEVWRSYLGEVTVSCDSYSYPVEVAEVLAKQFSPSSSDVNRREKLWMIKENPDYHKNVEWLNGDLSQKGLNLSSEDLKAVEDAEIVLHMGSSLNFKDPMRKVLQTNLFGTMDLLEILKNSHNCKCFMMVSSAYSQCTKCCNHIEEKVYIPNYRPESLIELVDSFPAEVLDSLEKHFMYDWPNAYTFTKSIIEYASNDYANCFPVGIFRPGNITSSYLEPFPYWSNSNSGILGAINLLSTNLVSSFYLKKDVNSHSIPVDLTTNALLASACQVAQDKKKVAQVYNYTSNDNPVSIYEAVSYALGESSEKILTENYYLHKLKHYSITCSRALLSDLMLIANGHKPRYISLSSNCNKFNEALHYFINAKLIVDNSNMEKLWNKLSKDERDLLYFDIFSKLQKGVANPIK